MGKSISVAVTARAFSRQDALREELESRYQSVRFNTGSRLTGAALVEFLKGHQKAIISLEKIDEAILSQLPDLRVISKYGVGLDNVDFDALDKFGVELAWRGGVNRRSVSELTLAFALCLLRHLPEMNRSLRNGGWEQKPGAQLSQRTVGIIGCGNIGKDLVLLLQPFGCRILAHDIRDYASFYKTYGVEAVPLEPLLAQSDVVSLHIPYHASTHQFLSAERLSLMRPGAILINTARGQLVDEVALKRQLQEKKIGGAGFDVFATEPPEDLDLLHLPNFFGTPHIGGTSQEAILAMGRQAIEGLESARPASEWRRELET